MGQAKSRGAYNTRREQAIANTINDVDKWLVILKKHNNRQRIKRVMFYAICATLATGIVYFSGS